MYITETSQLEQAVSQLRLNREVAIDTEFMREKTYYSKLCLIQIAGGEETYLIDPLQGMSLEPLAALLFDEKVTKVFHAGSQDLEIFFNLFGRPVAPVFDTQYAAALVGYAEQISYGALVAGECSVALAKTDSFTDWARRPLTDAQVSYARDDVIYLLQLYPKLLEKLEASGRADWLNEEFARLVHPATYEVDPREMWRKVKRISGLKPRDLAVVREVTEFREREAMRRNLPRKWVLPDETIVQIAHRKPRTAADLAAIRGITKIATSKPDAVLAAVERGVGIPDADLPAVTRGTRPTFDLDPGVDLVVALVRQRAKDNNIAMGQIATRSTIDEFVSSGGTLSDLAHGWRLAMVGGEARALLEGRAKLSLSNGKLIVEGE